MNTTTMTEPRGAVRTASLGALLVRRQALALAVVMVVAIVHIVATWGYTGIFWGDQGLWLHQVERFARNDLPYRDYFWPFPPVAIWLMGSIAHVVGTSANAMWSVMAVVYLLIILTYFAYVSHLLRGRFVGLVFVAGFVFCTAYAQIGSAPLSLGMYTPAAPLGFLLTILASVVTLRLLNSNRTIYAPILGILCGLTVLTKQDFWAPAVYLVAVSATLTLKRGRLHARVIAGVICFAFAVTILAGAAIIALQAGLDVLPQMVGGFGHAEEVGGRGLPTWERLTVELSALALVALGALSCLLLTRGLQVMGSRRWIIALSLAAIITIGLHLGMTYRIGLGLRADGLPAYPTETEQTLYGHVDSDIALLKRAATWYAERLRLHLFPALLPLAVLAFVIAHRGVDYESRERRKMLLLLLGLCVMARIRRGFEFTEWYQWLLEIPVYALVLLEYAPPYQTKFRRGLALALIFLALIGINSYWYFGIGPFTLHGTFDATDTTKGVVHIRNNEAHDYQVIRDTLNQLDPGGAQPLFAFGYTGGFNYYLNRTNPTPVEEGFRLSNFRPDRVVSDVESRSGRFFLLDNIVFRVIAASDDRIDFRRWEMKMTKNYLERFDRPYFEALLSECLKRGGQQAWHEGIFTLYDCPGRG